MKTGQFAKHQFFSNFAGAVSARDPRLAHNIVINEYASLVAQNPKAVIAALNAAGVKTPSDAKGHTIIDNIFDSKSPKVIANLNKLIALKHGKISANGAKMHADGDDDVGIPSSVLAQATDTGVTAAQDLGSTTTEAQYTNTGATPAASSSSSIWSNLGKIGMGIITGATSSTGPTGNTAAQQAAANKAQAAALAANQGAIMGMSKTTFMVVTVIVVITIGAVIALSSKKTEAAV